MLGHLSLPALSSPALVGEENGIAFLVMQYLEGETLASRLDKRALPVEQALIYAIQIAGALDRAHRAGIVHRDLKPGNIMITRSGAKLLDFGPAKAPAVTGVGAASMAATAPNLTIRGTILGTLQYTAPNKSRAPRPMRAAICSRSARCCTRCSAAEKRSKGSRRPRC